MSPRGLSYLAAGGLILAAWAAGFLLGAKIADVLVVIL